MITLLDIYHVVEATVPLYVAMILAYLSVKWWKLFNPDQCSGINKFVAKFSVPLLAFQVISDNNPYAMNLRLIISDFIQKLLAVAAILVVMRLRSQTRLDWTITGLALSTLPNTLVLGIPMIRAMYGEESVSWLAQIVVLQCVIWLNLLLFLYELNAARTSSSTRDVESSCNAEVTGQEGHKEAEIRTVTKKQETMRILNTVWKKMIQNPNTYATVIGLIWASIRFRWGLKLPKIISNSIDILLTGGLGMAMFSLGLFTASQTSLIACGKKMAAIAMVMKFLLGPALMATSSLVIGLRGQLLRAAILQAALPQAIVPFVFAKEYNVYPEILSTGVIFGMLIALPITLAYYFLLAF